MYKIKQLPEDFAVKELMDVKASQHGKYSYFLMKKRNLSTIEAAGMIARRLGLKPNQVGFSGSKDKKAVTEQVISVFGDKTGDTSINDITLKFLVRGEEPISLGCHVGNGFVIVVRNLGDDDINEFKKNLAGLKRKNKIPNYFDEQRFGRNNSGIGKAIVKKDFKKAVRLIIESDHTSNERMSQYLDKNKNDYVGALKLLPRPLLLMYVHAFQSMIFNRVVDELKDNSKNITIPLVGFGTELGTDKVSRMAREIMDAEGVTQRDFIIRQIPEISAEGSERELFFPVRKLKAGKPEPDELNNGMKKLRLEFELGKGSYATIVVKHLFAHPK